MNFPEMLEVHFFPRLLPISTCAAADLIILIVSGGILRCQGRCQGAHSHVSHPHLRLPPIRYILPPFCPTTPSQPLNSGLFLGQSDRKFPYLPLGISRVIKLNLVLISMVPDLRFLPLLLSIKSFYRSIPSSRYETSPLFHLPCFTSHVLAYLLSR